MRLLKFPRKGFHSIKGLLIIKLVLVKNTNNDFSELFTTTNPTSFPSSPITSLNVVVGFLSQGMKHLARAIQSRGSLRSCDWIYVNRKLSKVWIVLREKSNDDIACWNFGFFRNGWTKVGRLWCTLSFLDFHKKTDESPQVAREMVEVLLSRLEASVRLEGSTFDYVQHDGCILWTRTSPSCIRTLIRHLLESQAMKKNSQPLEWAKLFEQKGVVQKETLVCLFHNSNHNLLRWMNEEMRNL